jgi:hypothetical protein
LIYLALFAFLVCAAPTTGAAGSTYIGNMTAKAIPSAITGAKSTEYFTSLQILGDGRTRFDEYYWLLARNLGKTRYTIRYTISIREDVSSWFDKEIIKPTTYTRTATLVSGIPDMPAPIWVRIQLEDGRTVVPKTVSEAQSLMFDVSKSYPIRGMMLGRGDHRLFTQVKANWSGYQLSGTDKSDKGSPRVTIQVK